MTATNVKWRKVEAAYRAGVLRITEIAKQAGISEGTIRSRAKRHGWKRDLAARVKARTSEKLILTLASPHEYGPKLRRWKAFSTRAVRARIAFDDLTPAPRPDEPNRVKSPGVERNFETTP
jgi:hypothetical protein